MPTDFSFLNKRAFISFAMQMLSKTTVILKLCRSDYETRPIKILRMTLLRLFHAQNFGHWKWHELILRNQPMISE